MLNSVCVSDGFLLVAPQQTIETQLADEETTRTRLGQLSEQLEQATALLEEVTGDTLLPYIHELSIAVREAFSSPLAVPYCRRVWVVMAHSAFREWSVGEYWRWGSTLS